MVSMHKDTFFIRRRKGIEGKVMDLVLSEVSTNTDIRVAIIYAHGNETTYFLTHPHVDNVWPPSMKELKQNATRPTTMENCDQSQRQRKLMAEWKAKNEPMRTTIETPIKDEPGVNLSGFDPLIDNWVPDIFQQEETITVQPARVQPVREPSEEDDDGLTEEDERVSSSGDEEEDEDEDDDDDVGDGPAASHQLPKRRRLGNGIHRQPEPQVPAWNNTSAPLPPQSQGIAGPQQVNIHYPQAPTPQMYGQVQGGGYNVREMESSRQTNLSRYGDLGINVHHSTEAIPLPLSTSGAGAAPTYLASSTFMNEVQPSALHTLNSTVQTRAMAMRGPPSDIPERPQLSHPPTTNSSKRSLKGLGNIEEKRKKKKQKNERRGLK